MLSDVGMRPGLVGEGLKGSNDGSYSEELGFLLREQRRHESDDLERELNLYRSGSAPPTVEGSLAAVGGLFGSTHGSSDRTEEGLRSDPNYAEYYFSHVKLNPRLPPPPLSKEDWRLAQRLQAWTPGFSERKKVGREEGTGSRSLFSLQPGFDIQREEGEVRVSQGGLSRQASAEWMERGADGLIGLSGLDLGTKRNGLPGIFQEDVSHPAPISGHLSRPASRNAFDEGVDPIGSEFAHLHHENGLRSGSAAMQGLSGVHNSSHGFTSPIGSSLPRSTTPDPQHVVRSPSPCLPPVGEKYTTSDKKTIRVSNSFNGVPSGMADSTDLANAFSGISLSDNGLIDSENHLQSQLHNEISENFLFDNINPGVSQLGKPSYSDLCKSNGVRSELNKTMLTADAQVDLPKQSASSNNSYLQAASASAVSRSGGSPTSYQNVDASNAAFANYGLSGYSVNPTVMNNHFGANNMSPLFDNISFSASLAGPGLDSRSMGAGLNSGTGLTGNNDLQNLNRIRNQTVNGLQVPVMDPLYIQYLQRTAEYASQVAAGLTDPSLERNYMGSSYVDLLGLQKAYLGALLAQQKSQYNIPYFNKSGGLNHGYYGNPAFGLGMPYPGSPLTSPVLPNSPVGPGSPPMRQNDRSLRFASGIRGSGVVGSWHADNGPNLEENFASSLLEEFKTNKTKCELSEIAGHVVEFSADQYGSRFIQQKLETATVEEKNMVFQEIIPQALSLMTDVFGNYVIQKFFEHGTTAQRRELANQLTGHVLALSLQMYGCRVIQKAIEVVDVDQQTKMVQELDGHVMRCVRDQNGNHVIQKCIECIPQDAIQFIISSFYDQVVTLSTHPYGCRVIQRVLEHCNDAKTQQIMMDEILQCVCMLAQDQYGNYVVQHVLEHGKPHERSAIIKKLAGQIVHMSQQKFASNVVEKCLIFGGPAERQLLVNEMLGTTDENEPLQAMMKDQFANYVVQKVLETCEDQQRELILSRIKVHLNALKKYTYGKHIVARVEKLVAAGERRIGIQSSYLS
ncbi:hypothetical protein AMTRI_Chr08g203660 [Amborella trichopoda]